MVMTVVVGGPAYVSGLCGSCLSTCDRERNVQASGSGLYGDRSLACSVRPLSVRRRDVASRSPALTCVAVVWWSDAAKNLRPEWQKAHLMRVEKLETESRPDTALEDESDEDYLSLWETSLKSRVTQLISAGLTPEMIIGRTAMLGFLAATTVEFETGKSVLQQLTVRGEVASAVVAAAVVTMSLLLHRRYTEENGSSSIFNPFGLFNPTAERLNGQAAMLGFCLLIATEVAKGSALF